MSSSAIRATSSSSLSSLNSPLSVAGFRLNEDKLRDVLNEAIGFQHDSEAWTSFLNQHLRGKLPENLLNALHRVVHTFKNEDDSDLAVATVNTTVKPYLPNFSLRPSPPPLKPVKDPLAKEAPSSSTFSSTSSSTSSVTSQATPAKTTPPAKKGIIPPEIGYFCGEMSFSTLPATKSHFLSEPTIYPTFSFPASQITPKTTFWKRSELEPIVQQAVYLSSDDPPGVWYLPQRCVSANFTQGKAHGEFIFFMPYLYINVAPIDSHNTPALIIWTKKEWEWNQVEVEHHMGYGITVLVKKSIHAYILTPLVLVALVSELDVSNADLVDKETRLKPVVLGFSGEERIAFVKELVADKAPSTTPCPRVLPRMKTTSWGDILAKGVAAIAKTSPAKASSSSSPSSSSVSSKKSA